VTQRHEARSIMPIVAVPTAFVSSPEWLLGTSPAAKGYWLALLAFCTREENGGRTVGAAQWAPERWLFALGTGGSRDAIDNLVMVGLAEWDGSDLVVTGYSFEAERAYQQARAAGKKGAAIRRKARLARMAEPDGGEDNPTSPPPRDPPRDPPRGPERSRAERSGASKRGSVPRRQRAATPPPTPSPAMAISELDRAHQWRGLSAPTAADRDAVVAYMGGLHDREAEAAIERLREHYHAVAAPTPQTYLAAEGWRPAPPAADLADEVLV
jgi:hypothetical protein